ncbi:MAG: urea transporter [Victivallaceae bacterium]|nr:urea transporter [Victivallaceae bacterium]
MNIKAIVKSILFSYSQIFFSTNVIFGLLLFIVSFFDIYAGAAGLLSVMMANLTAKIIGFSPANIEKGLYGFNALLVGFGIGVYFNFSLLLLLIIAVGAVFTLFITVAAEGFLYKYKLPFLSIPFLIGMWCITLAAPEFTHLGISQRGIYLFNELYLIGGQTLIDFYNWTNGLPITQSFKTYLISLGAIFFQYNILTGIMIAIGLFFYSRIAFTISLLGFYTAFFFYMVIGSNISDVTYAYIGFNYILTAIAIGSFFTIPSKGSYLSTMLLMPLVVIITISLNSVFVVFGLSIYSLPFNFIVLLFLYILKLRCTHHNYLVEVVVQNNQPEENLYSYLNNSRRFGMQQKYFPVKLPFWGDWFVMQAHDGEYTHQEDWQHAWDFVIVDEKSQQFAGEGSSVADYYCYNKSIIAPAAGVVVDIVDGIEDNEPGEENILQNWGNSIVIKHTEYLYSQISHIKSGSFKVSIGEYIKPEQLIATCGNSGRSPYPHIHFQLQSTPYVGSKTLDYPLSNYFANTDGKIEFVNYKQPVVNQSVSNAQNNKILVKAFKFVSGQVIKLKVTAGGETCNQEITVYTDINNNSYLYCEKTKSTAFFVRTENEFYITKFIGDKKSVLFYLSLSIYRINFSVFDEMTITDDIQLNLLNSKLNLLLQDIIAPFYVYLSSTFKATYSIDTAEVSPQYANLSTVVRVNKRKKFKNSIVFNPQGLATIECIDGDKRILIEFEQ